MYNGKYFAIKDFKGGYCGNLPPSQLGLNQAFDLDNIVLKPGGLGWRTRLGNSKVNSTAFNSGAAWQGLGYLLLSGGNEFIVGVAGGVFGANQNSSGYQTSFTSKTYSGTITSGADNQWDIFTFGDQAIAFGGPKDTPDAPFYWDGSASSVTALGGTPPSAYGGFSANNRVFAFRTSANPSTIYWSIIGSAGDWTGTGSGSAVVGSFKDNEKITGAKVLSTNYVLIFKESSTYQMVISSNPFPIYTFSDSMGCVGKNACVVIEGTAYWINQYGRMVSTQGEEIKSYPPVADDLWNSVQTSRYPFINGFRQKGSDYDWLVWQVSTTGSTNNTTIIWDLLNQCWLRCSTGYKQGATTNDKTGTIFAGDYAGFVYRPDRSAVYADASESSPGAIAGFWRSGWINPISDDEIVQVRKMIVQYKTKASGSLTLNYGFDFNTDSKASQTLSQTATASEVYTSRTLNLNGRGNFFQYKLSQSSSTIDSEVESILLGGKVYGQKRIGAS